MPASRSRDGICAAEGIGSPDGWLWTATMAVACWRTASRKTSVLRRKRAAPKRKRQDKGGGRQARRVAVFLEQDYTRDVLPP